MAVSVRLRFEVFKRDSFTCQYCGRTSPECVLEVDHIIPVSGGGPDDVMNLTTSCWDCNRRKSNVPLETCRTGEDPHDRAIALIERERQLREYNAVLKASRLRREEDAWDLLRFWMNDEKLDSFDRREFAWVMSALETMPPEQLYGYMLVAMRAGFTRDLRYVKGCVKIFREGRQRPDGFQDAVVAHG